MSTDKQQTAEFITMKNEQLQLVLGTVGAAIVSLKVKDKSGKVRDVVLGYEKPSDYDQFGCYFGAVCGPVANRIAKGRFTLNNRAYQLDINNGENHLHGGANGLNRQVFSPELFEGSYYFTYKSTEGIGGYPGNVEFIVCYTLEDNQLIIDYQAESDRDTIVSLTNHSYFNLNGHDQGDILDHYLQINASSYLPTDAGNIPLGYPEAVEGTPFDFREAKKIGQDINADHPQLKLANGYDHSFCVARQAATLFSENSGIAMDVITSLEGMQLYTGNWIDNVPGKHCVYHQHSGVALETQFHPDAINQPAFTSPILRKGQQYFQQTIYSFRLL